MTDSILKFILARKRTWAKIGKELIGRKIPLNRRKIPCSRKKNQKRRKALKDTQRTFLIPTGIRARKKKEGGVLKKRVIPYKSKKPSKEPREQLSREVGEYSCSW